MTLTPFSPDALDALALRLLDLAGMVRGMANSSRENQLEGFELHANKVQEWLGQLEDWAHEGAAKLEHTLIRQRGMRRAQAMPQSGADPRLERSIEVRAKAPKK
jgi:hypothetical protein